jgi:hypothetical protein
MQITKKTAAIEVKKCRAQLKNDFDERPTGLRICAPQRSASGEHTALSEHVRIGGAAAAPKAAFGKIWLPKI